jgi:hypothetical protein
LSQILILPIPDPVSRILDPKTATKERGEKNSEHYGTGTGTLSSRLMENRKKLDQNSEFTLFPFSTSSLNLALRTLSSLFMMSGR